MLSDNIKINVEGSGFGELVVREGKASVPIEPAPVEIHGFLDAPGEYLLKRPPLNAEEAYVKVSEELGYIELYINSEYPQVQQRVMGRMSFHPKLEEFGLLREKKWDSPQKLGEFLRRNRRYFADQQNGAAFVHSLLNFKARVEKEIEKSNDNRGNKRDLVEQKVIGDLPTGIVLLMPIFKGEPPSAFLVEVFFEVRDAGCQIVLQSVELEEIAERIMAGRIAEQLEHFKTFPIIRV